MGRAHAKAARGPVVTKGVDNWAVHPSMARRDGCSESCPADIRDVGDPRENYVELESMPCGLIVFASQMSRRGSIATSCSLSMAEVATDMVCCSSRWVPCPFCRQIGLEPSYLGTSAEPPDKTCKRCWYSCSLISPLANRCAAICCGESSAGDEEAV